MSLNFAPPGWVQKHLKEADKCIEKYGLHTTAKKYAPRINLLPKIIFQQDHTQQTLKNSPILIVANHPHEVEPLILYASLPPRPDSYLVANIELLAIFPNAKKHLLPVYIKHRIRAETRNLHPLVQFVDRCYPQTHLSFEKAHQKNIKTINTASKKINQGHQLVIFPENRNNGWQPGVGHIVSNLDFKNNPKIVMTYITGATKYYLFRPVPIIRLLFPQVKIYFSKPFNLSKYKNLDPKTITKKLEQQYKSWVDEL